MSRRELFLNLFFWCAAALAFFALSSSGFPRLFTTPVALLLAIPAALVAAALATFALALALARRDRD